LLGKLLVELRQLSLGVLTDRRRHLDVLAFHLKPHRAPPWWLSNTLWTEVSSRRVHGPGFRTPGETQRRRHGSRRPCSGPAPADRDRRRPAPLPSGQAAAGGRKTPHS